MIRVILMAVLVLNAFGVCAKEPVGFLWYNLEKEVKTPKKPKQKGVPFKKLSYSDQDAVLHFYTMEALHKARVTKKVEDMRAFLSLQHYWLGESTRFRNLFQKTMLAYPQYDYQVTHPNSKLGIGVTDNLREAHQQEVITKLSQSHGLLFFYRGKSAYDLKQIPIIADFCKRHNLSLRPISVDGVLSPELQETRFDNGQADRLGVRYFPALLLVNPKTKHISPVSYGLITQDVLAKRLVQVATHFRGEE